VTFTKIFIHIIIDKIKINGFVACYKLLVASVKQQADSENTASLLLHMSLMFLFFSAYAREKERILLFFSNSYGRIGRRREPSEAAFPSGRAV